MRLFFIVAGGSPDAQRHLQTTINNPFDIRPFHDELPASVLNVLRKRGLDQRVRMWGAVPTPVNLSTWDKLQPGDRCLVYAGNYRFRHIGHVIAKARAPRLATAAWAADSSGQTWEYLYFLDDVKPIDLLTRDVNLFVGYNPDFFPRGFGFVSDEKLDVVVREYGSVEEALSALIGSAVAQAALSRTRRLEPRTTDELALERASSEELLKILSREKPEASLEERQAVVRVRRINDKVIATLKKLYDGRCQICGYDGRDDYGVSIGESHHLEGFALTQNNRPDNILILCPNHHTLIHAADGVLDRNSLTVRYSNGREQRLQLVTHLE